MFVTAMVYAFGVAVLVTESFSPQKNAGFATVQAVVLNVKAWALFSTNQKNNRSSSYQCWVLCAEIG